MNPSWFARLAATGDPSQDPEFIRQTACHGMLKDWEMWFGRFLEQSKLGAWVNELGAIIKDKHTVVGAWPCKVGVRTTKKELEVLCASGLTGYERYVEVKRRDG
jgi:hypothetical protein